MYIQVGGATQSQGCSGEETATPFSSRYPQVLGSVDCDTVGSLINTSQVIKEDT